MTVKRTRLPPTLMAANATAIPHLPGLLTLLAKARSAWPLMNSKILEVRRSQLPPAWDRSKSKTCPTGSASRSNTAIAGHVHLTSPWHFRQAPWGTGAIIRSLLTPALWLTEVLPTLRWRWRTADAFYCNLKVYTNWEVDEGSIFQNLSKANFLKKTLCYLARLELQILQTSPKLFLLLRILYNLACPESWVWLLL